MSRRRRNETEEQRARRELISDFLSAANIQSMDDIQELFKEALSGFMEGSLESELDSELGYEPYDVTPSAGWALWSDDRDCFSAYRIPRRSSACGRHTTDACPSASSRTGTARGSTDTDCVQAPANSSSRYSNRKAGILPP